jgi:hypothetical protein
MACVVPVDVVLFPFFIFMNGPCLRKCSLEAPASDMFNWVNIAFFFTGKISKFMPHVLIEQSPSWKRIYVWCSQFAALCEMNGRDLMTLRIQRRQPQLQ